MICERCDNGHKALFRITSEVIDLQVCLQCAKDASLLVGEAPDQLNIETLPLEEIAAE